MIDDADINRNKILLKACNPSRTDQEKNPDKMMMMCRICMFARDKDWGFYVDTIIARQNVGMHISGDWSLETIV